MKLYPSIPDNLARWAEQQPFFLSASASRYGPHINVSPKGLDAHFAILNPNQCAYIDRSGSGCETVAHCYENGRLCLMFMSFGPTPRIMRLFCRVSVYEADHPKFPALVRRVARGKREIFDAARAVFLCDVFEAQTSCGFGVPRVKKAIYAPNAKDSENADEPDTVTLEDVLREGFPEGEPLNELSVFEERPTLDQVSASKTKSNEMGKYQVGHNQYSLDGLPGLRTARRAGGQRMWLVDAKARMSRFTHEGESIAAGFLLAVLLRFLLLALPGVRDYI